MKMTDPFALNPWIKRPPCLLCDERAYWYTVEGMRVCHACKQRLVNEGVFANDSFQAIPRKHRPAPPTSA